MIHTHMASSIRRNDRMSYGAWYKGIFSRHGELLVLLLIVIYNTLFIISEIYRRKSAATSYPLSVSFRDT